MSFQIEQIEPTQDYWISILEIQKESKKTLVDLSKKKTEEEKQILNLDSICEKLVDSNFEEIDLSNQGLLSDFHVKNL